MGVLAAAGMISGAGQGLGRGLDQLQTTALQSYLADEKAKADELRQQRLMEFELEKQKADHDFRAKDTNRHLQAQTMRDVVKESAETERFREDQDTKNKHFTMDAWQKAEQHKETKDLLKARSEEAKAHEERMLDALNKRLAALGSGKGGAAAEAKEYNSLIASYDSDISSKIGILKEDLKNALTDTARKQAKADWEAKYGRDVQHTMKLKGIVQKALHDKLGISYEEMEVPSTKPGAEINYGDTGWAPSPKGSAKGMSERSPAAPAAPPATSSAPHQPSNVVREGRAQLKAIEAALAAASQDPSMNPDTLAAMKKERDRLAARWGQSPTGLMGAAGTQPMYED